MTEAESHESVGEISGEVTLLLMVCVRSGEDTRDKLIAHRALGRETGVAPQDR